MEILEKKGEQLFYYRNNIHNIIKNGEEQRQIIEYIDNYLYQVYNPYIEENELQKLIDGFLNNDKNAKEKLLDYSLLYIVPTIIKNYSNKNVSVMELINEVCYTFLYKWNNNKLNADNFYGYLCGIVNICCSRYIKKEKIENVKSSKESYNNIENDILNAIEFNEIIDSFDEKQKKYFYSKYILGYTQKQVAHKYSCTPQTMVKIIRSCKLDILKEKSKNKIYNDIDMYIDDLSNDELKLIDMILNNKTMNEISKYFKLTDKNTDMFVYTTIQKIKNKINSYVENGSINNNTFDLLLKKDIKYKRIRSMRHR